MIYLNFNDIPMNIKFLCQTTINFHTEIVKTDTSVYNEHVINIS